MPSLAFALAAAEAASPAPVRIAGLAPRRQPALGVADGVLEFLDVALPECRRMVDVGGALAVTSLHAAQQGVAVDSVALRQVQAARLEAALEARPRLAGRVRVHDAAPGAQAVASLVAELGVGPETLLRLELGGLEYEVVPALAELLARGRPFLAVAFAPGAVVREDAYLTQLARLRGALAVAEAVGPYRHMYVRTAQGWTHVERRDRGLLLGDYLLRPKPLAGEARLQYGFTDLLALSDVALPLG